MTHPTEDPIVQALAVSLRKSSLKVYENLVSRPCTLVLKHGPQNKSILEAVDGKQQQVLVSNLETILGTYDHACVDTNDLESISFELN
jgi:hypothetical protein